MSKTKSSKIAVRGGEILEKTRLLDLSKQELEEFVINNDMPKFRAKQLFEWLYKGAEFPEMSNIPAALREKLSGLSVTGVPKVRSCLRSSLDETCKFLFEMQDGVLVESVLMKYKYGWSVCISSQAGCRMGCKFCASSQIPFSRSLSPGEILGQIIAINRHESITVSHVVIMGIGEPLDNYDNIIKFLRLVTSPEGLNISARKLSLSTCGVVPKIYSLAEEQLPVTLSISLHNPFDSERSEIMPVNRAYNLDSLFEACRHYQSKTGRRITFEYSLISGVNDSERHGRELAKRLKGMLCHVNLIPVNTVDGSGFRRPDRKNIEKFRELLEKQGIPATVRRELGRDISAACGQLRKSVAENIQKKNAAENTQEKTVAENTNRKNAAENTQGKTGTEAASGGSCL